MLGIHSFNFCQVKSVFLPPPLSVNEELECEFKRKEFTTAFDKVAKLIPHSTQETLLKGSNTRQQCKQETLLKRDQEVVDTNGRKRKYNYRQYGNNSNLSKDELAGMKSLKDRIKHGEIHISQTDKSLSLIHI